MWFVMFAFYNYLMKRNLLLVASVLSFAFATSCKNDKNLNADNAVEAGAASDEAVSYMVDTAASVIEWTGSKPTGKHNGTIKLSGGNLFMNGDVPESGNFTIDMSTITVLDLKSGDGKEDLEAHLKGANQGADADHFFNTGKFPVGRFEITRVKKADGKTLIEGNLTIKETTKNIKIPASVTIQGDQLTIVSDEFAIDRTLWNVNYGSKSVYDNLGDKFINDNIDLKVTIKASK